MNQKMSSICHYILCLPTLYVYFAITWGRKWQEIHRKTSSSIWNWNGREQVEGCPLLVWLTFYLYTVGVTKKCFSHHWNIYVWNSPALMTCFITYTPKLLSTCDTKTDIICAPLSRVAPVLSRDKPFPMKHVLSHCLPPGTRCIRWFSAVTALAKYKWLHINTLNNIRIHRLQMSSS